MALSMNTSRESLRAIIKNPRDQYKGHQKVTYTKFLNSGKKKKKRKKEKKKEKERKAKRNL